MNQALEIVLVAIPIIVAITFHEAAHGFVARYFGDPTASEQGRVTLNPLKHVDPFGTVILPMLLYFTTGFIFGYAKPVPVDFGRLRHPRRDMIWVAAAGPGTNLLLVLVSTLALYLPHLLHFDMPALLAEMLWVSVEINLLLAVFNLIPLPPLDGSKVAIGLLPLRLARPYARLERFGILIVLAIFIVLPMLGLNVFPWLVNGPVAFLERPIRALLGNPV